VNDTGMNALMYLAMLVLPLSALASRRLPLGQTVKMALIWVAIFAGGLLLYGLWQTINDRSPAIASAKSWATGILYGNDQTVTGGIVKLRKQNDGHFYADVTVNGIGRRMLIDSGATTTALSTGTAKAAGLNLDESPFGTILDTANGKVSASVSTVKSLQLGSITASDLPVVVSENFGDQDVLGMNFLSRLQSWRVEGDWLILQPRAN
jgi:aspartyl protease family protein